MNRKLIRPNLADVKPKEPQRDARIAPERSNSGGVGGSHHASAAPRRVMAAPARDVQNPTNAHESIEENASAAAKLNQRRNAPPAETSAKIYYYKKQIDSHTKMRILLQDNEEVEGTIEWYDRDALKINRKDAPNIMLLEHNIKYMYKVED